GVSVVLISISSLKISLARASFGPDCATSAPPARHTIAAVLMKWRMTDRIIGRDILRPMRFAPEYVTCVLNENFEDAKELLLSPLMAIHYAHVVMLHAQGI